MSWSWKSSFASLLFVIAHLFGGRPVSAQSDGAVGCVAPQGPFGQGGPEQICYGSLAQNQVLKLQTSYIPHPSSSLFYSGPKFGQAIKTL